MPRRIRCVWRCVPLTAAAVAVSAVALCDGRVYHLFRLGAHGRDAVRHSYAEKERLAEATTWKQRQEEERQEKKLDEKTRRLEERNEQLRAEKERLLYDVQRRDRPLDDDGDRSAIRRGLQAEPGQPHLLADGTDSSETGAPAPSDALPPAARPSLEQLEQRPRV